MTDNLSRYIRRTETGERIAVVVTVTDAVLVRVGRQFPVEPIRTLDAVHLATAEELAEPPRPSHIIVAIKMLPGRDRGCSADLGAELPDREPVHVHLRGRRT